MAGVLVAAGVTPSTAPHWGTCTPWAVPADVCAPCTADTADLADWLQVASDLLFELSGQRFPGLCSDTVRPCTQTCRGDSYPHYQDSDARYYWYGACACNRTPCGCTGLSELWLTGWPLVSVDEILIDGAVLDPTLYRVDNWNRLIRLRDPGSTTPDVWPPCQQLDLATTEADTFEISFTYGATVPLAATKAAAEFGCQLALACAASSECRLPQRVQSITRQGVSMVLLDPFQFLQEGLTGLGGATDYFLTAYGPKSKQRWGGLIANPDRTRRVTRTTG